jgi:hypothetical protein
MQARTFLRRQHRSRIRADTRCGCRASLVRTSPARVKPHSAPCLAVRLESSRSISICVAAGSACSLRATFSGSDGNILRRTAVHVSAERFDELRSPLRGVDNAFGTSKLWSRMLSPGLSQRLGRELCDRIAAHPRPAELVPDIERVVERARAEQATDEDVRLAVAIVLALASGGERPA